MAELQPSVLVVDDERFFREAIAGVLGEAGLLCEQAETRAEALAAVARPEVAVVVLDVALGGGLALLGELREARPGVRVIVVSAEPDHERVLGALRIGACDYLAKPLHDEELVLSVRRALAGYDVEARGQRLRQGLRRAQEFIGNLAAFDDDGSPEALERFANGVVAAVAEVLQADKTSLMLYDADAAELRVSAATGSELGAEAMDPVALGEGVAGVALSLGEALLVEDVYSDARFPHRAGRERYESGSIAVVPLRTDRHALGVLCATDRAGGVVFGEDELAIFELLAVPAIRFLAERVEGVAQPAPEPLVDSGGTLAFGVCSAIVGEIEPRAVLEGALRAVSLHLQDAGAALFLIDNRTGTLLREHEVVARGPGDRSRIRRDRGLTSLVLQAGRALVTAHPEREEGFDPDIDTAADGEGRPLLCLPLRLRGKVVGVLRAFPGAIDAITPRDCELVSTTLSAAVRNVLLYRSLIESIDELSEARREAGAMRLS